MIDVFRCAVCNGVEERQYGVPLKFTSDFTGLVCTSCKSIVNEYIRVLSNCKKMKAAI